MFKLDKLEKEEIINSEIICLIETWHTRTVDLPAFLKDDHVLFHEVLASKDHILGRASGGIMIFTKKNIQGVVMDTTENYCMFKLNYNNEQFILGVVYFKPSLDNSTVVNIVDTMFEKIENDEKLILAGDFNSRIGDLNYMEPELLLDTNLRNERQPKDKTINSRGQHLVDVMSKYGMIVLNGRIEGDIPGEFTFAGTGGVSTVDLVWVNINMSEGISKLEVAGNNLHSDHLPLRLHLTGYEPGTLFEMEHEAEVSITKYTWNDEKKLNFTNEIDNNITSSNIYTNLQNSIHRVSEKLNLFRKITINRKTCKRLYDKPWYNNVCRTQKFKMRQEYRRWKRKGINIQFYLDAKKKYSETVKKEEKNHNEHIQKILANVKNSREFWNEVKKYRRKKQYHENKITVQTWEEYLHTLFDQSIESKSMYNLTDARHEYFDKVITTEEMLKAIVRMKNQKTPGPDGLINEQIKNLNIFWYDKLLSMYNYILDTNEIPDGIARLDMIMIHKKGSRDTPDNYRSIALLNNLFKILTQILASRIYAWCENNNIINDGQMGFRKNRGCLNGIFTLCSIVSLRINSLNKKLYAAFIDFRKAFSSVPHDKLWQKLFSIGLSSQIIRTIASLYSHARASIKVGAKHTSEVRITAGVLEGDPLSALAFILYISDLEQYYRQNGATGVSVNNEKDILTLMYADDLVILADGPAQMQRNMDLLQEYCHVNGLTVNVDKSSIVVFKKSGRPSQSDLFSYKGEKVKIQNTFNYLGIMFSSSGLFLQATLQAKRKACIANSSVIGTLVRAQSQDWSTRIKLYETIAKTSLLYGAEVWALRYLEELESSQLNFYRAVMKISRSTPGYIVRRELGIKKISQFIIKQTLLWWVKILSLPDNRYTKICYTALARKHELQPDEKYNWVSQLVSLLRKYDRMELWESQNPQIVKPEIENILKLVEQQFLEEDERRIFNSSYSIIYRDIQPGRSMAQYLTVDSPMCMQRTLSQLRTAGKIIYLNIKGDIHTIDTTEECTLCNFHVNEDLTHFLTQCPMYRDPRILLLGTRGLRELLGARDRTSILKLHRFVLEALKIRSLILLC